MWVIVNRIVIGKAPVVIEARIANENLNHGRHRSRLATLSAPETISRSRN